MWIKDFIRNIHLLKIPSNKETIFIIFFCFFIFRGITKSTWVIFTKLICFFIDRERLNIDHNNRLPLSFINWRWHLKNKIRKAFSLIVKIWMFCFINSCSFPCFSEFHLKSIHFISIEEFIPRH